MIQAEIHQERGLAANEKSKWDWIFEEGFWGFSAEGEVNRRPQHPSCEP